MHEKADRAVLELHDDDSVFLAGAGGLVSETLAQIHDWNYPAAQIDHALDILGRVGDGSNFRNANDFAHHRNGHTERLMPDAEANDLKLLVHDRSVRLKSELRRHTPELHRGLPPARASGCRLCVRPRFALPGRSGPWRPASCGKAWTSAPLRRRARSNSTWTAEQARACAPWHERRPARRRPALRPKNLFPG